MYDLGVNKTTIEQNKKLIEKYPFLLPRNDFSDKVVEDYDYSFTELDCMPIGWKNCFGLLLCEDILKDLEKYNRINDYRIFQIKEKYGTLRWYDNGLSEEFHDTMCKYEALSGRTCIECGKVGVPIIDDGWISPLCKDCYEEINKRRKYQSTKKYEDFIVSDVEFSTKCGYTKYTDGKSEEHILDFSDILKKIDKKYYNPNK